MKAPELPQRLRPPQRPPLAVGPLELGAASAATGGRWFMMPSSLPPCWSPTHASSAAGFFIGVNLGDDAAVRALLAMGSPDRSCILAWISRAFSA